MIKSNDQKLDEFIIKQILSMNENELEDDFKASGLVLRDELKKFKKATDSASLSFRKQKLTSIQTKLKETNIAQIQSNDVMRHLKEQGRNIKDILVQLFLQGDIPEGMTLAFREGQEITDEELEDILDNLIELGVVKIDKPTDSK